MILSRRHLWPVAAGLAAVLRPAAAQDGAPLSLLVGYAPGGSADLVARVMAARIAPRLNRPVVVENVAGASGMLALQRLVAARPDSAPIYFGGFDTVAVPLVNRGLRLDWRRDAAPAGRTTMGGMVVVVPAASPWRDIGELFAAARRQGPDSVSYGTPGVATAQHLLGEMINLRAGIRLLHSPYRGGNLVLNDVIAGNLQAAILVNSTALPSLRQGGLRALAVSTAERAPALPEVPALRELPGFGDVAFPLWQGIFARAGAPAGLVAALDSAIREALAEEGVRRSLADAGFEAAPMAAAPFAGFVAEQEAQYRTVIEAARLTMDG